MAAGRRSSRWFVREAAPAYPPSVVRSTPCQHLHRLSTAASFPMFPCSNQRTSDLLWIVFDVWLGSDSSSCVLSGLGGTHKGRCLVIARRPCRDQGHRHGTSGHGTQQSTTGMVLPPPELGPPGRIHFTCRQPNPPPSPIHVVPRVEEEVVVRSAGGPPWTVATNNSSGEKEPNQIAPAF